MTGIRIGPPTVIDAPLPVRPRFGLLDTAQVVPPSGSERWLMGADVYAYPATLPSIDVPCGYGSTADAKDTGDDTPSNPQPGPFTVYLPLVCSTFSERDLAAFRARAEAILTAREDWAIEREFAAGNESPDNTFLAKAGSTVLNSGSATSPRTALGLLENSLAGTGSDGIIHADPFTATTWASLNLIARDGNVMRTVAKGTRVAVGGGYAGVRNAAGAAPSTTKSWAWATGPIAVYRTAVEFPGNLSEVIDRSINKIEIRAERHYLIAYGEDYRAAVFIDNTL